MRKTSIDPNTFIPLSVPSIQGNEWKYIKKCLNTEWVSSAGKYVDLFEEKICEYCNVNYAVAVVNGTAALQVALRLVGVKENDEVIVPTLTFIAPVNVVKYFNAHPVFMDCDDYYNIDVAKTKEFIENETYNVDGYTYNKKTHRRISAIIPVHIYGNAVKLENLISVCKEHNIKIVEDATESLGSYYTEGNLKNKHTGTVGDVGCYSFNGNKIITTGGGGMIVTNNQKNAEKAKYLTTQAKNDPVRYVHNDIGYNFRMINVQAAMGVAQLELLRKYLEIKKKNYQIYKKKIDKIPGLYLAEVPDYASNNHWMYPLQIDKEIYGKDRELLMAYLSDNRIQTRPIWYPNHLQKPYKDFQTYQVEKTYEMLEKTLNIPCSVNLTLDNIEHIISTLKNYKNPNIV